MDTQTHTEKFVRERTENKYRGPVVLHSDIDFFATNSPQRRAGQFGEWRNSAGYRGYDFRRKNGPKGPFLSVVFV